MNWLDPIDKIYNMYLEDEETPHIMEIVDDRLDMNLDLVLGD